MKIRFLYLLYSILPLAEVASAFPSNIRLGYTSCAACHVDVTGGSLLTPYGRMAAGEVMSSWTSKNESDLLHGLMSTSDALDIGGDFQYVSISTRDYERSFVMQREVQIGVNYDRQFFLTVGSGLYGEFPETPEMRKVYLQANLFDNWTFKVGRFFPAFGIMSNEHLYIYRSRYFNQGRETYNAEAIYRGRYFEIAAAKVFGHPNDFANGVLIGKEGFSSRISITPTKSLNFGASYYVLIDPKANIEQTGSVHLLWGIQKNFWMESQIGLEDVYFRLGVEPSKGFFVRPTVEYLYNSSAPPRTELNFQWLPRPHFDFQLTCSKTTWVLLLHYYL